MKTYHEMIQFIVDQVDNGKLRYFEWPAIIAVAEAYSIDQQIVFSDVEIEATHRKAARKLEKLAANQASNQARRLANIESQQ